jgi:AraC family transcriptional regulator, regulatory protein of adaptative response / methylated-DNA-[protein]-cysteine methyltransferase
MNLLKENAELARTVKSDSRWGAIVDRKPAADGKFYYSVKTTGVYCRPSCAARLARPENVAFHATRQEAEKAGFRPCKRCKPDRPSLVEEHASKITAICRLIEQSDEPPRLDKLAAEAGMSVFHFHRVFKAVTGLTPNGYAKANMAKRVRTKLGEGSSVTEAIYDAGFNSNSRFYETSNQMLGMTPSEFRAGGSDTDISFAVGECSLGSILVATSEKGVCAILIGGDPAQLVRDLQDQFPKANLSGNEKRYEALVAKVVGFVEQPGLGLDLPLDIRGTAFQQRVWKALREIPVGGTASYAMIAKKIGLPKSVRAVAQACAANSLAVAIPCHRVIRTNGSLSGYRWGVERKRTLLDREARA